MKATRTTGTNNFQYAQIVLGEFHVKVDKDTPGAIERTNKNGEQVFELVYNTLEDIYLHEVEVRESEYGNQAQIYLRHADNKDKFFVIQTQLNSGYAQSFLNRAKQVDLSKPVVVKVFEIENKDELGIEYKTKTITISQDGKLLDKTWTKENNPVPKAELLLDKKGNPIKKDGKEQYDSTEKENFFAKYINEVLNPWMKETRLELLNKEQATSN